MKGIYYAVGQNDFYPPNLEYFDQPDAEGKLSALDAAINIGGTSDSFSSLSDDADARNKFKEYGFYTKTDFIYNIETDGSKPAKAKTPNYKNDLHVIFLNTNACNNRNVGLMRELTDPGS